MTDKPTSPPFESCKSLNDIISNMDKLVDRFGKEPVAGLLEYAKYAELNRTRLIKPPLISKLPSCISISLDSIRRVTVEVPCDRFTAATGFVPVDGFSDIRRMLDFDELPRLLHNLADLHPWIEHFTGKPCKTGMYGQYFYRRIKREAYLYMKSGKTGLPLAEIRRAVALYAGLQQENDDIRRTLTAAASPEEIPVQNALAELVFSRIPRLLQSVAYLDISKICETAKFKIQALDLNPAAKIAVTHQINSVSSLDQIDELAREKLPELLGKLRTDPRLIRKATDLLSSYTHEADRLSCLYEAWFLPEGMRQYFTRYRPKKLGLTITKCSQEVHSVPEHHSLQLYPAKDLLEYLKGEISHDCTTGDELARQHLETPEFFNLRVVWHDMWAGNIYCLDFSETHQCCIIDKVQVPRVFRKEWNGFFQEVILKLAESCGKVKLLLPENISNQETVYEAFAEYKKSLPAYLYEPNHFKNIDRFASFESVSRSRKFLAV